MGWFSDHPLIRDQSALVGVSKYQEMAPISPIKGNCARNSSASGESMCSVCSKSLVRFKEDVRGTTDAKFGLTFSKILGQAEASKVARNCVADLIGDFKATHTPRVVTWSALYEALYCKRGDYVCDWKVSHVGSNSPGRARVLEW